MGSVSVLSCAMLSIWSSNSHCAVSPSSILAWRTLFPLSPAKSHYLTSHSFRLLACSVWWILKFGPSWLHPTCSLQWPLVLLLSCQAIPPSLPCFWTTMAACISKRRECKGRRKPLLGFPFCGFLVPFWAHYSSTPFLPYQCPAFCILETDLCHLSLLLSTDDEDSWQEGSGFLQNLVSELLSLSPLIFRITSQECPPKETWNSNHSIWFGMVFFFHFSLTTCHTWYIFGNEDTCTCNIWSQLLPFQCSCQCSSLPPTLTYFMVSCLQQLLLYY